MIPRPPIATVSGLGAQPSDSDLTSIAAVSTAAFGRGLLALADQAALLSAAGAQAASGQLTALSVAPIVVPALSAAAKAGNAVVVTINLVDAGGSAVSRTQRLLCRLYAANMLQVLAAAFTIAETGAGTGVSTTNSASLLLDTDASGDAAITLTDVSTIFTGTLYLEVVPVSTGSGGRGVPCVIPVSFA